MRAAIVSADDTRVNHNSNREEDDAKVLKFVIDCNVHAHAGSNMIPVRQFKSLFKARGLDFTEKEMEELLKKFAYRTDGETLSFLDVVRFSSSRSVEEVSEDEEENDVMVNMEKLLKWLAPTSMVELSTAWRRFIPFLQRCAQEMGPLEVGADERVPGQVAALFQMIGSDSLSPCDSLTIEQFRQGVRRMGLLLSDLEARALFQYLDDDNNGIIDLHEFAGHVIQRLGSRESPS